MSVINLDSQTIQTLGSEITALDSTLLQGYFPELESELNNIASNVQGDELHSIINTINSQFGSVKSVLSTELPKLETFLNDQMKSYTQTEEELDAELTAVLSKMAILAGEGPKNLANGNSESSGSSEKGETNSDIESLKAEMETLKAENEALKQEVHENSIAGYWEDRGTDFANNFDFENCNNVLDYGVEGMTGSLRSVGDAAETLLDGFGPIGSGLGIGVSETVNAITWAVDGLIGKGFKWNG